MNVEEERQRIMELWGRLDFKIKASSLAFMWEHRGELGELEARVESIEPKVIKLLEVIPTLKRDSPEFRAHCENFIRLIHHIEPTEEWMQKIKDDLDFISGEIQKIKDNIPSRRDVKGQKEQIAHEIVQLYNSGDYNSFRNKYMPKSILLWNVDEVLKISNTTPLFKLSESGSFWLVPMGNDIGFVVPRIGTIFSEDHARFGGGKLMFELRGYRQGYRYRSIRLIKPAIFKASEDVWKIIERGILELSHEERE